MERTAAARRYASLHEDKPFHDGTFTSWSDKASDSHPYMFTDGVTLWVAQSDLSPHDHFLGGAASCEECRPKPVD